jgi:hypothetical protein
LIINNCWEEIEIYMKKLLYLFCLLATIFFFLPSQNVKADDTLVAMDDGGNFHFTTTDTAATTNTTWETIGFTVRRDYRTDYIGNYDSDPSDGIPEYATFALKSDQQVEGPTNSKGEKTVTFFLTKKQVNTALVNTGMKGIQDNDVIYVNGIIKVHNPQLHGVGPYYTLYGSSKEVGITNAEYWKNPDDFKDRFNKKLIYKSGPAEYPVTITSQLYKSGAYVTADTTYYKSATENSDTKVNFKTHDEIELTYHNIPKTREDNGQTYYLYRVYYQNLKSTTKLGNRKLTSDPNIDMDAYDSDLAYIRNRTLLVQGDDSGDSLNIVAIYRRFPIISQPTEDSEEMIKDYEEPDPTAVIASDVRGNETYDVSEGIPGTDTLYANAFTCNYIAGSIFTRKYGKKLTTVKVNVTYDLNWTTTSTDPDTGDPIEIHHHESRPMTYSYPIYRDYSYWIISSLGVYGINNTEINNNALPGGSVTLTPVGYNLPTVTYNHSESEDDHLTLSDEEITINKGTVYVNGSSVPGTEYKSDAEAAVPKIRCKNDKLIFNGITIMSDSIKEEKTDIPQKIPSGLNEIGDNVLYKPNLVIPGTMANGEYESTGSLKYKTVVEINPSEVEKNYEIEVNSVIVHTPTVCDARVQSNYTDNQMVNPDLGRASLVLDRPFYVTLPADGNHLDIRGYGYRDYSKYIASRQVKFPFDTYKGSTVNGTYISAGTWTSIEEDTQFYLPTWVNEGKYTIYFRSETINSEANNGSSKTEPLANTDLDNYVATDTANVEVSGRIYGLNLYDISDYPIWENVFRIPNSLALSGFKYTVGTKDQNNYNNGQNSKYTLALVNGSHPEYLNIGAIKTGYVTRFSLQTVGNMYDEDDYIRIIPTFYYVDYKGKNRQEVDIYYSETFNGKKNIMVKMGSNLDLQNKKSLRTGDPYLAIPETALKQTAHYEGIPLNEWKAKKKNVFTFTNMMIPDSLRTFVGYIASVPSGVTEQAVAESVQNWYGEYYLPSEIHVLPKNYSIEDYVKNYGSLSYKEPFWLKEGYIIVNFQIETIKDGERHLSYINADNAKNGYCNMWKREGYQYEKKDYSGNEFSNQDGDYVLYNIDKSAAHDYKSAGTH